MYVEWNGLELAVDHGWLRGHVRVYHSSGKVATLREKQCLDSGGRFDLNVFAARDLTLRIVAKWSGSFAYFIDDRDNGVSFRGTASRSAPGWVEDVRSNPELNSGLDPAVDPAAMWV